MPLLARRGTPRHELEKPNYNPVEVAVEVETGAGVAAGAATGAVDEGAGGSALGVSPEVQPKLNVGVCSSCEILHFVAASFPEQFVSPRPGAMTCKELVC